MEFEIVRNKGAKSSTWDNFGFVKYAGEDVNKKAVACKICRFVFKYSGNTTNLQDHLNRKHPGQSDNKKTTRSGKSDSRTVKPEVPSFKQKMS